MGYEPLKHDGTVPTCFNQSKASIFLRLYPIKWAMCENRCLYIGINVKARLSSDPPTSKPLATISLVYPLIVTLLWCFNNVLYLWSRFIYYLVFLCYIIYIQSKSYVHVYITLKDILLKSHEIMLIFANLTFNWIHKYCNDLPSTACIITSHQLEWNALVHDCDSHIRLFT